MLLTFFRYLISGGLATSVHFSVLIGLLEYHLVSPVQATMLGAFCGFLVNYPMQYAWTFKAKGPHKRFFARYLIVTLLMFALNAGIFWLASLPKNLDILLQLPFPSYIEQPHHLGYWYAQIIATGIVFFCNFLINHFFTFTPVKLKH
jgi:putative flippase GtrA